MHKRADLFRGQRDVVEFIKNHEIVSGMIPMGFGKTVSSLTAFADLLSTFDARRALVIAPLRVARRVWSDEVRSWEHLSGLTVARIVGTPAERMRALRTPADIHTINREQLPWLKEQFVQGKKQVMRWPWDIVFNDEAQGFKAQSSKRWKALWSLRWGGGRVMWPRMVNLSGTPTPNGYVDLWAQYKLLDGGKRLGTSEEAFRQRFFIPPKEMYGRWELRDKAAEEIQELISDITVSQVDEVDAPPVRVNDIRVDMPENVYRRYRELERGFLTELFSGTEVSAANAGVCMGKLCQLANGAIYTGEEPGKWEPLHDEKLGALVEAIESANGNPCLVVYSYKHDYERMGPVLDRMGVRWSLLRTDEQFDAFRNRQLDVGILHPASAGHGLNDLHLSGAEVLIHFGMTANMEWYNQVNARLIGGHRRVGKNVVIHRIICERTVDEDLIELIELKDHEDTSLRYALAKRFKLVG